MTGRKRCFYLNLRTTVKIKIITLARGWYMQCQDKRILQSRNDITHALSGMFINLMTWPHPGPHMLYTIWLPTPRPEPSSC